MKYIFLYYKKLYFCSHGKENNYCNAASEDCSIAIFYSFFTDRVGNESCYYKFSYHLNIIINDFQNADAYWIRGNYSSKQLQIEVYPLLSRHIIFLSEHPEKFGFTSEHVKSVFNKYKEKPGIEGYARQELMLIAIRRGWIRVRKRLYKEGIVWIVQADNFEKRKQIIEAYFRVMRNKSWLGKYDTVKYKDIDS